MKPVQLKSHFRNVVNPNASKDSAAVPVRVDVTTRMFSCRRARFIFCLFLLETTLLFTLLFSEIKKYVKNQTKKREQTPVEPNQGDERKSSGGILVGCLSHVTDVWMEPQICHHVRDFEGFKPAVMCFNLRTSELGKLLIDVWMMQTRFSVQSLIKVIEWFCSLELKEKVQRGMMSPGCFRDIVYLCAEPSLHELHFCGQSVKRRASVSQSERG